jgi:hypothetical protein
MKRKKTVFQSYWNNKYKIPLWKQKNDDSKLGGDDGLLDYEPEKNAKSAARMEKASKYMERVQKIMDEE